MPGGHRAWFLLCLLDHGAFSSSSWCCASQHALTFPHSSCPSDAGMDGYIPMGTFILLQVSILTAKDINRGYCRLFLCRWFKRLWPCHHYMMVPRWVREAQTCSRNQGPALDLAGGGLYLFPPTDRSPWSQGDLCASVQDI